MNEGIYSSMESRMAIRSGLLFERPIDSIYYPLDCSCSGMTRIYQGSTMLLRISLMMLSATFLLSISYESFSNFDLISSSF